MKLKHIRDKKALFASIVDQHRSDIRLLRMDIVLLCLDGVGLKVMSLAVRYLGKPERRAVSYYHQKILVLVLLCQ